jgi:DNA mismatch repair protein MutH
MAHHIESTLHVNYSNVNIEIQIQNPKHPDVRIGPVFITLLWEVLWFLVPMWAIRPLINKRLVRALLWEIEKNLYRLASQWSEECARVVEQMAKQAEAYIRNEMDTIRNMLANARDMRAEIDNAIADIVSMMHQVTKKQ